MSRIEKRTEHIDEDGVITRSLNVISITKLPPEPNYIKLYVDDISRMFLVQESHREILLYIAASSGYDGFVTLTKARKMRIAVTVSFALKTVDNAITELLKVGLLRRVGRCEYELNPSLFAKGEWSKIRERRETFNMSVSYSSKEGRVIRGIQPDPD